MEDSEVPALDPLTKATDGTCGKASRTLQTKRGHGRSVCAGFQGYFAVITFASFMSNFVFGGVSFTTGIYFVLWWEEFDTGSGLTSLPASIHLAILHLSAPLSSYLTHHLGFRWTVILGGLVTASGLLATAFAQNIYHIIVSFSVISGIGVGIFYVPALTIVSYGVEGKALANGISASGLGAGILVMSYVIPSLIETYYWRGSYFLLAGIALQVCVFGALMREPKRHRYMAESQKAGSKMVDKLGFKLYCNPCLVLYLAQYMTHIAAMSIAYVHVVKFADILSATARETNIPVTILGITQILGRFLAGVIAQISQVDTFLFYLISTLLAGLTTLLLPLVRNYISIITWCVCYGLLSCPANSLYQIMLLFFLDISELNAAMPHLVIQMGIGVMLGAPIAGWLFDMTHDYANSFHLAGALLIFGSLLLIWPYIQHRKGRAAPRNMTLQEMDMVKKALSFSNVFGSQHFGSTMAMQINGSKLTDSC